jgi:hypothetical protein
LVEAIAWVYWPLAVLVVVAFVRRWRRTERNSATESWLVVAAFLTLVVLLIVLGALGNRSAVVLVDWHILNLTVGSVFLVGAVLAARHRPMGTKLLSAVLVLGASGLAFASLGAWHLVGDFPLPRRTIEAVVDKTNISTGRLGQAFHVYLDGQHHPTTADVYRTARIGERVRASVGLGSGNIFSIEAAR